MLNDDATTQQPRTVPTPAEMAQLEPVFSWPVHWPVCIGKQISDLAASAADIRLLIAAAPKDAKHLIGVQRGQIIVCLHKEARENEILLARFHAETLRQILLHGTRGTAEAQLKLCGELQDIVKQHHAVLAEKTGRELEVETLTAVLQLCAPWCQQQFRKWESQCLKQGWRTDRLQLPDAGWRATWGNGVAEEKSKSN